MTETLASPNPATKSVVPSPTLSSPHVPLTTPAARIAALRTAMARHGLDAMIVPSADPHSSEYLPARWQGRQWLSGFTGSVGTLVVTAEFAGLWADSRYWVQAEAQLEGTGITLMKLGTADVPGHGQWLARQLARGARVGVDGQVLSLAAWRALDAVLRDAGMQLDTSTDLLESVWAGRPALPRTPIYEHLPPYACVARADKLRVVREAMRTHGAGAHLISSLDDIAWLLNLRSADVEYNPVFVAHLLVLPQQAVLFVQPGKVDATLQAVLARDGVSVRPYDETGAALAGLAASASAVNGAVEGATGGAGVAPEVATRGAGGVAPEVAPKRAIAGAVVGAAEGAGEGTNERADEPAAEGAIDGTSTGTAQSAASGRLTVLLDPARVTVGVQDALGDRVVRVEAVNPSTLAKARKTDAEIEQVRAAMEQDGAALCEFFAWFEAALGKQTITELDIERQLAAARGRRPGYVSPSFGTIAGFNANGAMPHYRATVASRAVIEGDGLLLIDSGGQYLGGTTDITRVVPVGQPNAEQRRDFTLVLRGMIALSRARFPRGLPAPMLDAIARAPIWEGGAEYGHGTGHGVGYFLNVHEGPQVISYRAAPAPHTAMEPGMITSNEPGIYRPGRWGVRIENLVCSRPWQQTELGEFLAFETLTLCPIDSRCIDIAAMRADEIAWLDAYHREVRERLLPLVEGAARAWLLRRTEPLAAH